MSACICYYNERFVIFDKYFNLAEGKLIIFKSDHLNQVEYFVSIWDRG